MIWNEFNRLGLTKSKNNTTNPLLDIEQLNKYYVNLISNNQYIVDNCNLFGNNGFIRGINKFELKEASIQTIKKSLMRISTKAQGPDNISI